MSKEVSLIVWSSSESENDKIIRKLPKRLKKRKKMKRKKLTLEIRSDYDWISTEINELKTDCSPSNREMISESPILGKVDLETSPVLSLNDNEYFELSPVLGKRMRKLLKQRKRVICPFDNELSEIKNEYLEEDKKEKIIENVKGQLNEKNEVIKEEKRKEQCARKLCELKQYKETQYKIAENIKEYKQHKWNEKAKEKYKLNENTKEKCKSNKNSNGLCNLNEDFKYQYEKDENLENIKTNDKITIISNSSSSGEEDYNCDARIYHIEPIISQKSQVYSIQPILSQESSLIENKEFNYDFPVVTEMEFQKKKKKYKKNSFSSKLEKALSVRDSKISIWKHELFLTKQGGSQFLTAQEKILVLILTVQKCWVEFGCKILKCIQTFDELNHSVSSKDLKLNVENRECLVIVDSNISSDFNMEMNDKFKLLPPYYTLKTYYEHKHIDCYFNITRYLKLL